MTLPYDLTRCAGNSGKAEDDFRLCPVRFECVRFTSYFDATPDYQPISRMFAPDDCEMFIQSQ